MNRALAAALLIALPASAELLCNPEDGGEAVHYRDEDGRLHHLVDFRFEVPAWQRPNLACNRWLDSLGWVGPLEVRSLYGGDRPSLARLAGPSRDALYRACAAAAPCKVAFPYNLAPDARFQALQLASRFRGGAVGSPACNVASEARVLPPARSPRLLEGLTDVKTWFTPVTRFADEVAGLVASAEGGAVLVSTMTVSTEEVRRIVTMRPPGTPVFLLFDLNALLAEGTEGLALFEEPPPGVELVPVFNTPKHARYYHVKGAASVGGMNPRLVFTGANLKGYDRMALFDLGFSARGADAARALAGVLARQAQAACDARERLACTLDSRFDAASPWRERIAGALDRSCTALAAHNLADTAEGFLASDRDALLPALLREVGLANRSIDGTSHHLDHPDLLAALGRRAEELPVQVTVGGADVQRAWVEKRASFVSYGAADRLGGLQPHAKALLIDDRRLVWGSPNLTEGGLGESLEVLFATEDVALVGGYRRYLATLRHLEGRGASLGSGAAPGPRDESVHLWLPPEAQRSLDQQFPDWRSTVTESRPGLGGFFRALPALAACLSARDPLTFLHGATAFYECQKPRA